MDIRQWLNDTADREPPDQEEDFSAEFLRAHSEPEQHTRKYRRKRKRASSDSSIIEPRHPHHKHRKATDHAQPSNDCRGPDYAVARSRSRQSSQSSESLPEAAPTKTYEKRARHKTRPDCYEPKAKNKLEERQPRENPNTRSKRRKSHRSGDGGRTTGLVQSFQLKNGPKNNRLTLKPEITAGLFKHGRASAQVTGRGAGLPDLVFNEMRFLQRPKEHQDEHAKDDVAPQPTKKDRRRQHEEEISAYFSGKGPRPFRNVEGGEGLQRAKVAKQVAQEAHPRRANRQVTDPELELPDKPFLGFGSKGIHTDTRELHPTSNSYLTWSDSAPHLAKPRYDNRGAARAEDKHGTPTKHRRPTRATSHDEHQASLDHSADGSETKAPGQHRSLEHGAWHQSRRAKGPALVEVYQPPVGSNDSDRQPPRSMTKTTLQSLPRQPSLEPSGGVLDDVQPPVHQARSYSYHTSDIFDVRQVGSGAPREPSRQYRFEHQNDTKAREKENQDPRSSTLTSKLLRQARDAVANPRRYHDPSVAVRPHLPGKATRVAEMRVPSRDHVEQFVVPEASVVGTPENSLPCSGLRERHLQSAAGLSRVQRPAANHHDSMHIQDRVPSRTFYTPAFHATAEQEGDEMLDEKPDIALLGLEEQFIFANARQAEDLVHALRSDRTAGLYEAQAEYVGSEAALSHGSARHLPTRTPSVQGLSTEQDLQSDRSVAVAAEGINLGVGANDDFAGFWKPHKLY